MRRNQTASDCSVISASTRLEGPVLNSTMQEPASIDYGNRWKRILRPEEVSRAVFLDFEAQKEGPQVLLGVLTPDDDFVQYVVDPFFDSAAEAKRKGSCPRCWCLSASLTDAIEKATQAAHTSGGPIVGYTRHELAVVVNNAREYTSAWKELYRDGKQTAKRWARRFHPDHEFVGRRGSGKYSLDQFLKLAGYKVPRIHGAGNTGNRISYVRKQLERHGSYEQITPTAKKKWANLLMHNHYDVHGLRELTQTAAKDLRR